MGGWQRQLQPERYMPFTLNLILWYNGLRNKGLRNAPYGAVDKY